MPAQIATTAFPFIDTYNHIREDMQAGRDYEEELDCLEQQQGVPQFSFSSSPPFPTTTTTQTTLIHNTVQQVTTPTPTPSPSPSLSLSPSPRSCTPSPTPAPLSPHCPPAAATQPGGGPQPAEGMMSLMLGEEDQFQTFLDMDIGASFLEELIGQPTATPATPVTLAPPQPPPALTPSPFSTSPTTTTTYVAEAAAAGCTVVQTSSVAAGGTSDQQLLTDMEVVDFYDMDKQGRSFYDDLPAVDSKLKETLPCGYPGGGDAAGLVADLDLCGGQPGSGSGSFLTELGTVGGSEQEDLLCAFDSLRRDILQDCRQLSLSPNPKTWSAQDSQAWVTYMLDKFQRPDDCSASLALPGPTLCQKNEVQLLWLSPSNGGFLRQQLDLWLAVADLPALPSKPQQQQQQQQQQQSFTTAQLTSSPQSGATLSHRLSPSVSPAPSTDSACSSDQSSSSSSSPLSLSSSSLSSSPPSDAEMSFWCQESSSSQSEDMFHDSSANLSPPEQPPRSSTKTTTTAASGRQPGSRGAGKQIRLWEFLKELLEDSDPAIKWLDQARGVFKIEDSNRVARLWGQRKNHPAMNYDKLSRSVRQYYKKGIIKKTTQTRRLVYQFCERYL